MVRLHDVAFQIEHSSEEKSYFIELDTLCSDVQLEARCVNGVVVNAVQESGETVFLAQGDVVRFNERVYSTRAIELVADGGLAYRVTVSPVKNMEVLDPRPATVVTRMTEADQVALLVREEVARRLDDIRSRLEGVDGLDVDDIMEDIKSGDMEFDEDEDDFVSTSYEDLAEEPSRFDQVTGKETPPSSVSATSGGSGAGNEAPDSIGTAYRSIGGGGVGEGVNDTTSSS